MMLIDDLINFVCCYSGFLVIRDKQLIYASDPQQVTLTIIVLIPYNDDNQLYYNDYIQLYYNDDNQLLQYIQ